MKIIVDGKAIERIILTLEDKRVAGGVIRNGTHSAEIIFESEKEI